MLECKMSKDQEIIALLNQDRRAGMKLLFREYYRPLFLFALHYVADSQIAEDIVQDLFVRLWEEKYLDNYIPGSLKAYLFTSVRNACYTECNRKDILRDSMGFEKIDIETDVALAMNQEIVDRIMGAIEKQPLQTRRVLDCILMQDMKYKEVADVLSVTVNTVKTLLRVGMKSLREELKDSEEQLILFFIGKILKSIHPF